MLQVTECIGIKNKGRDYTDCMEFSLLRFLHLIFYSEEQIKENNFSTYELDSNHEIKLNEELCEYIRKYPKIYQKATYYCKESGVDERESWAQFVSDRDYFQYYRTDGAELFTNIANIIIFGNKMLGLDLDLNEDEEVNLKIISNKLSSPGKKIKIKVMEYEKKVTSTFIDSITSLMSKEQDDMVNLPDGDYNIAIERTKLKLQINDDVYNWNLYGVYFTDETVLSNRFVTGHSVITRY